MSKMIKDNMTSKVTLFHFHLISCNEKGTLPPVTLIDLGEYIKQTQTEEQPTKHLPATHQMYEYKDNRKQISKQKYKKKITVQRSLNRPDN